MAKVIKWDFRWAFLFTILETVLKTLPSNIGYHYFSIDPASNEDWISIFLTVLSVIICFILTMIMVVALKSGTLSECLQFLGFKTPNPRQLLAGLIILIPMVGLFLLIHELLLHNGWPVEKYNGWEGYGIKVIFVACILEETVFRGFLFQVLRVGRSFWSAALLSGFLWSFSHLAGLCQGYSTKTSLIIIGFQMLQAFLLSIPAAYLFERGGNNIWGWMLVHGFYDLGIFLTLASIKPSWTMYFLIHLFLVFVSLLMGATTSAVVHDFLPLKTKEKKQKMKFNK